MSLRERIWICTALGGLGGLLAGGLAGWSGQAVFPVVALWAVCGVLTTPAVTLLMTLGRLVRCAICEQACRATPLPYGRPLSPAARWAAALIHEGGEDAGRRLGRQAAFAVLALVGVGLLTSFFGRQVAHLVYIGIGVALLAALLPATEPLVVAVLTATAWGAASVSASSLRTPQLLAGMLAALWLAVATCPGAGRGWRTLALCCGAALGLLPAIGQQPALASLIWVSALLSLAWPRERTSGALQVAAGLSALAGALAVGYWG